MGNKKKLIKKGLTELFSDNINTFVDVFAGSGIVAMNTKANKYIINDAENHLAELYTMFREYSADVIIKHIEQRIDEFGLARERTKRNEFKDKEKIQQYKAAYMKLRKQYNEQESRSVFDFYTLMFYSFSQQFRFNNKGEFNMPCGNDCFSEKNKEYIRNGGDFFKKGNVKISSIDFKEMDISEFNSEDYIYLDPPYLNTTATYTENEGWNEEDESKLYEFCENLTKNNIRFGMSNVFENKGVVNQRIANWCRDNKLKVYVFDKFTYMACGKGNSNAKEVFITNYET